MKELNNLIDCLKEKTEETFEHYAKKDQWTPEDLEALKNATKAYDKMQNIQMNTGVWEQMKRTGDYSYGRVPRISYGHDGRHYPDERYWDDRDYYSHRRSYGDDYGHHTSTHSVKDQAIQRLESLMDHAESDYERQQIMDMIKTIEKDHKQ